ATPACGGGGGGKKPPPPPRRGRAPPSPPRGRGRWTGEKGGPSCAFSCGGSFRSSPPCKAWRGAPPPQSSRGVCTQKHWGREHHHVIEAHGIHGALGELHLTVKPGRRRLRQLLLVHDAAGHVLVERTIGVQQAGRGAAVAERLGDVAQHVVVDAVGHFRPERGFVDVGVA